MKRECEERILTKGNMMKQKPGFYIAVNQERPNGITAAAEKARKDKTSPFGETMGTGKSITVRIFQAYFIQRRSTRLL